MPQMMPRLESRFVRDRRGNVVMLFGLFGSIAFVTAGGALDYGRWMHARYHTARALDAAVLAGGRALQIDNANPAAALTLAKKVYDSNVGGRLTLLNDTIQFVTADNNMAVTASGQAAIRTTLLGIVGIQQLPVAGTAGAKFPKAKITAGGGGSSNMEIALMLDVTGSMCADNTGPCTGGSKLTGLKDAAKELVNIVVQADQSTYTSRVALVPFSTRVRVGPDAGGASAMLAMTNLPSTWSGWYKQCTESTGGGGSEGGGNWACTKYVTSYMNDWKVMPCVTDRVHNNNYIHHDAAPGGNHWMNAHDGGRRMLSYDSGNNSIDSDERGDDDSKPARHWNYVPDGDCADVAEANEMMPLSADKTALTSRIDGLEAYGATAGALGTAMAWHTLSPNWSSVWPTPSEPGSYAELTQMQPNGKPKRRKVAVLMTDGGYNTMRGWKEQNQTTVSNHAKQLCTNMREAGIEIYAVGFALNELPLAEQTIARETLQHCGGDLQHFYETLTVAELKEAFKEIAMAMTTVYLSE